MYIGVDIGGTKVAFAASLDGRTIQRQSKIDSPPDPVAALTAMVEQIRAISGDQKISGIGVAAPGALDLEQGVMLKSPNLPWTEMPIGQHLGQAFNCSVKLINDASAAALAEAHLGAAQDHHYVLYVTLSTGVNASLVIAGQPYRGNHGMESGHIIIHPDGDTCGCGGRGHLEAYVSGSAIKRRFGRYGYEIVDPAIWDTYAADLALGLFNLSTVLSPDIVVIGGGVSVHFGRFIGPLQRHLDQLPGVYPPPKIVQAKYTETAGLYGSLALAANQTV